jgi:hypothetical protein
MAMDAKTQEKLIARIDAALALPEPALAASPHEDLSGGLSTDRIHEIYLRMLAAARQVVPPGTPFSDDVDRIALPERTWDGLRILSLSAVLRAVKAEYEDGYLSRVEELVRADVFSDFLEMAEELLDKGYKDAAAVIAGSVLEERLRELSTAFGVDTEVNGRPVKADKLNADLAKAGAYNKLQQKVVTALIDLRNNAAHGNYDEYTSEQVTSMIRDIRSFLARFSS